MFCTNFVVLQSFDVCVPILKLFELTYFIQKEKK